MVLVWFGVTGSEVMFLCLHTFLFYSILMVTVVHLLNIRSRQHSAQLISHNSGIKWEGACIVDLWRHSNIAWGKDFYLESTRFVMVRDSAYMVPS